MSDRAAALRELDDAWADLQAVIASLSDSEAQQPGVADQWSVKDLLGHMAFWSQKGAADLQLLAGGRETDITTPGSEADLDEWNARESAGRTALTLPEAKAELERSHAAARKALADIDPQRLEIDVKGWTMAHRFAEDTYRHYAEHATQIREWQRQTETTEA